MWSRLHLRETSKGSVLRFGHFEMGTKTIQSKAQSQKNKQGSSPVHLDRGNSRWLNVSVIIFVPHCHLEDDEVFQDRKFCSDLHAGIVSIVHSDHEFINFAAILLLLLLKQLSHTKLLDPYLLNSVIFPKFSFFKPFCISA